MAGKNGKMSVGHRVLTMNFHNEVKFSDQPAASFADMDFGYFQENDQKPSDGICHDDIDDEEDENPINVAESKQYWDDQNQLLQATLIRTSSIESKIRQITKEGMREYVLAGEKCVCRRPVIGGGCRSCMRREICERLGNAGFNSAICTSKWRKSPDIPSGEHTYLDVKDKSDPKKGEIRVVVELNFRAEFEMARASEDYNKLINRLPEVFVGKAERLRTLIKVLCSAAKKCMKENKMHMGPWRKQKYMQAKWFGTCERTISSSSFVEEFSSCDKQQKTKAYMPKASMLTFDLLENLPRLQQFTAVRVL
ncbi:hypothetical protein MKW98_024656 [Papaver atlanticum]|uniref:Uncharacterized protein n=1 Tax=Papaver atlanticum TaxID=357466 RepID=A0AAD4S2G5_9MAGN|nr:hypothetical protein MKW98_024656 [Papaver atlanticum]